MDWERTQLEVLERDGYRCNRCGCRDDLSVYLLSSMRGRYDLAGSADCMTVCRTCDPSLALAPASAGALEGWAASALALAGDASPTGLQVEEPAPASHLAGVAR